MPITQDSPIHPYLHRSAAQYGPRRAGGGYHNCPSSSLHVSALHEAATSWLSTLYGRTASRPNPCVTNLKVPTLTQYQRKPHGKTYQVKSPEQLKGHVHPSIHILRGLRREEPRPADRVLGSQDSSTWDVNQGYYVWWQTKGYCDRNGSQSLVILLMIMVLFATHGALSHVLFGTMGGTFVHDSQHHLFHMEVVIMFWLIHVSTSWITNVMQVIQNESKIVTVQLRLKKCTK